MSPATTGAAPPSPGQRRLKRLLLEFVVILWMVTIAAALPVGVALVWQDGLGPVQGRLLDAHHFAFMAQTFAFHAGLAACCACAMGMVLRRRRLATVALFVGLFGAGPDVWRSVSGQPDTIARTSLKLMSVNLMYGDVDYQSLRLQIFREAPDLILFQEWTPSAIKELRPDFREAYPHTIEFPRDDAFGQAIYSRREFVGTPRIHPSVPGWSEPQISVVVDLDGRALRVQNIHLLPPVDSKFFAQQRAGALALAAAASGPADERPHVLMGDFNAVYGSSVIRAIRRAGMIDAQASAGGWRGGRGSTWPRLGVLRFAPGLQLDHALVDPILAIGEARVGEDFGSDHKPVIVRIGWR